jgi:hypothetical protein
MELQMPRVGACNGWLPPERQASACLVEIFPEEEFLIYGIGVPLLEMRDPAAARGRVPVTPEGSTE